MTALRTAEKRLALDNATVSMHSAARFIRKLHRRCRSWKVLETATGINRGSLWRIAHNESDASDSVVEALRSIERRM